MLRSPGSTRGRSVFSFPSVHGFHWQMVYGIYSVVLVLIALKKVQILLTDSTERNNTWPSHLPSTALTLESSGSTTLTLSIPKASQDVNCV